MVWVGNDLEDHLVTYNPPHLVLLAETTSFFLFQSALHFQSLQKSSRLPGLFYQEPK